MDTILENVASARLVTVGQFIEAFNAEREAITPKLEQALDRYAERVERDAVAGLNRPSWLLSRSIARKVKKYQQNQKLWAIVGVKREAVDPRDPGVYGVFHEAGWTPAGRRRRLSSSGTRTLLNNHRLTLTKFNKAPMRWKTRT